MGLPTAREIQRLSLVYFGLHLILNPDVSGRRHIVVVRDTRDETRIGRLRRLGLTEREAGVLLWLARGKSNEEIGIILDLRTSTIRTHLRAIFGSLGVENRTAAAACAWEVQGSLG